MDSDKRFPKNFSVLIDCRPSISMLKEGVRRRCSSSPSIALDSN